MRWDATGATFVLPAGLHGNFHLVPASDNPAPPPLGAIRSLPLADKEAAVEAERAWEEARKKAGGLMVRQEAGGKLSREEERFLAACVQRLEDEAQVCLVLALQRRVPKGPCLVTSFFQRDAVGEACCAVRRGGKRGFPRASKP